MHGEPSFTVGLRMARRAALVVGVGSEGATKAAQLVACGARVTVVGEGAPVEELAAASRAGALCWYARPACDQDLQGVHLVVLSEQDSALARHLWEQRRRHGYLLCAMDQPEFCDFFNVSTLQAGPLQVSVGSAGRAPALAGRVRRELERGLDGNFEAFAEEIAQLRESLTELSSAERRGRLQQALRGFAIDMSLRYPATKGSRAPGQ